MTIAAYGSRLPQGGFLFCFRNLVWYQKTLLK